MKRKTSSPRKKVRASGKSSKLAIRRPRGFPAPSSAGEAWETGAPVATDLYHSIATILRTARANAYRAVNFTMVEAYWNVGRTIVEDEQRGQSRAEYGAALLKNLAGRLTREFGRGFTETNLKYFRQFYLAFPPQAASGIGHTLCDQLNWSHYRLLMRVESTEARAWYLKETLTKIGLCAHWSVRSTPSTTSAC